MKTLHALLLTISLAAFALMLTKPAAVQGQTITLYTANVRFGQKTNNAFDFQGQLNVLQSADIVGVQERTTTETGWNTPLSNTGMSQAVFRENGHGGDGPAIWVKNATVTVNATFNTALSTGFIGWNGSQNVDKAAVGALVTVGGKQFYVFNTHLCWSACADSSGSQFSTQRVSQINALLSWVSGIAGNSPHIILGDMNFAPNYPKSPSGLQIDLFTGAGYTDLWQAGLTAGTATADWGDRDEDSIPDMPLGSLTSRTLDSRRIDYLFAKGFNLVSIDMPDLRATCSVALTTGGNFKQCPDVVSPLVDFPEDQGVKPSDHNWIEAVVTVADRKRGNMRGRSIVRKGTLR